MDFLLEECEGEERDFFMQFIKAETSSITNCILKCFSLFYRKRAREVCDVNGASDAA